jgi:hypothetical protein
MVERFSGVTELIFGGVGGAHERRSADPERDVLARFPCLAMSRSEEAKIEEVVLMLKVL